MVEPGSAGWRRPELTSASGFEIVGDTAVHTGFVIDVVQAQMRDPEGGMHSRDVVRHPGAVSVLPLHDDDTVTLVRQYRVAPDGDLLEIPAGKADVEGEAAVELARRELAEEVGLEAESCERLAGFFLSPGYSNEWHETFLATGLSKVPSAADGAEERHMDVLPVASWTPRRSSPSWPPHGVAEVVHVATGNSGSAPRSDVTVEAFLGWLQVERGRASATVEA